MIRILSIAALMTLASAASPRALAAEDEERFIDVTPMTCASLYETLIFTWRFGEVVIAADEIVAQRRHETLRGAPCPFDQLHVFRSDHGRRFLAEQQHA
ncbi:MAG: hypothetical protein GC187_04160 [Alphaproteobacteria bacterium]|nr:hypothetical protein [Alphaproteobacteria bacterium]